ncbi:GNAT family N-acetyltransferase [Naasia aerilata]|uniref:N-acetyltransferase n=1 Tax=Naasia aerilata TaxID=1162966 RepID=A0ABM8GC60_9MICO|nr:GNAT family N-acetyltransferase [Naasia aerilata]BDZ45833.1 N-acetyltransferase [Naasia aerilata]
MTPVVLRTDRLVLDQPLEEDVDDIVRYCQDPLFERYLTVPWPYGRADAESFVREFVPQGWMDGRECTWALRLRDEGALLGVVAFRSERSDLGYWLGAPFRGRGYMSEAVAAVVDFAFQSGVPLVRWECLVGNTASATLARKAGFAFTGEAPSSVPYRDGSFPASWHGVLHASQQRPAGSSQLRQSLQWPLP